MRVIVKCKLCGSKIKEIDVDEIQYQGDNNIYDICINCLQNATPAELAKAKVGQATLTETQEK